MQEARSDRLRQLAARVAAGVVLLAAMTAAAVVGRHAAHLRGAVLLAYALAIVAAARLLCLRGTLLVGTVGILCSVFLLTAGSSDGIQLAAETGQLVVITALRPPGLEELGVSVALEQHVHALSGPRVPRLVVELDPVGPRELAWEATMAVFRVAQEAIRNVIQHAGATQARITLRREDATLWLAVSDDGVGFEAPSRLNDLTLQMTHAHHFGLANMVEWAASVGGRLTIASQPGQGTQGQLSVPLRGQSGDG